MSKNTGTLITDSVRPYDSSDTYAVAYANELQGGFQTVANDAARNAIPVGRQSDGMVVNVLNSASAGGIRQAYQLSSTTWIPFIDTSLSTSLLSEISTRLSVDISLSSSIVSVGAGVSSLSSVLSSEISTRLSVDKSLSISLSTEISTRLSVDISLSSSIGAGVSSLSSVLSSEISTRLSVDKSLSTSLSTEISIRLSVDISLSTSLSTEISVRLSVDTSLSSSVDSVGDDVTSLSSVLSSEISTRLSVDKSLSISLSSEISTRFNQVTSLSAVISSGGIAGVTSLSTALATEISTRLSADKSLSTTINTKAPIINPTFQDNITLDMYSASGDTGLTFSLNGNLGTIVDDSNIGVKNASHPSNVNPGDFNIQTYNSSTGNVRIGRIGTGQVYINNDISISGNSTYYESMYSPTFYSGFGGSGWKLDTTDSGNITLTVDDLYVRNAMNVYELVINKIRATNGSLWVSDSTKISGVTNYGGTPTNWHCIVDTAEGEFNQSFLTNDIIRCQVWNGSGIKYYSAHVTNIDAGGTYFECYVIDGSDAPAANDVVVRVGNSINTNRQGSLYLTADDSGAPYLDVLNGVTGASFANCTKVRLGNLAGITDVTFGGTLSGYGMYSQNVYLTGAINATSGLIGGWTINSTYLAKDVTGGAGMAPNDFPFYAGSNYANRTGATFRVDTGGTMTSTAGLIGGWTINSTYLAKNVSNGAGMAPNDYPFYAGSNYANRTGATFRVDTGGTMTSTAGSIGGWTINSTYLAKDVDNGAGMAPADYPFYAGSNYANRSSAEFKVDTGGTLTAVDAVITGTIIYSYTIGNSPWITNVAQVDSTSTSYYKCKVITLGPNVAPQGRTLRIYYQYKAASGSWPVYAQIRKNGVVYGAEEETTNTSWAYWSQDLTFNANDAIELWAHTTNASYPVSVQNLEIRGSCSTALTEVTGTSS